MEHFLRVSFKYRENPFEYDQENGQESYQKHLSEIQDKIIALIKKNPSITQKEIAKIENCSIRAIQYSIECALKNLKNFLN